MTSCLVTASICHGVAGVGFDLVPDAELGGRFPDVGHRFAGVTGDHGSGPFDDVSLVRLRHKGRGQEPQGTQGAMQRSLDDFLGRFSVERRIEDRRAGAQSWFEGRAEITAQDDGALYLEKGDLILGAQRFTAERSYLWRPAGARIEVLFDDGRPFHDFDPVSGGQATEHLCGDDVYRGGYDFREWSCWSVTWEVSGPRKDYASVTWYVRR